MKANFASPDVLIGPALKTGKLTLLTNAMAREVTVGKDGLATGVTYVDKKSGTDKHVRAKIVVLAPSACEPARRPLNPQSSPFPQGPRNPPGWAGQGAWGTRGEPVPKSLVNVTTGGPATVPRLPVPGLLEGVGLVVVAALLPEAEPVAFHEF